MKQISYHTLVFVVLCTTFTSGVHARNQSAPIYQSEYSAPDTADLLQLSALSVLVLDQKDGLPLYQKNVDMETPIASITKLMTAMVVLDARLDMNEILEIMQLDVDKLRHTSSRLPVGTRLSRGQLMHLALIASENRAASALSQNYPGGHAKFIAAMNQKAKNLGMRHTTFEDATGLSSANRSTAADLAKMVQAAMNYPIIHEITTTGNYGITRSAVVMAGSKNHKQVRNVVQRVDFHNTNQLVREQQWEIGLSKTGFINEAGHCLVMQAKIAQKPVIIVLLDSYGRYGRINDAKRIKAWLEQQSTDQVALRSDKAILN